MVANNESPGYDSEHGTKSFGACCIMAAELTGLAKTEQERLEVFFSFITTASALALATEMEKEDYMDICSASYSEAIKLKDRALAEKDADRT